VGRLRGQVGEEVTQTPAGDRQEAPLAWDPEQHLRAHQSASAELSGTCERCLLVIILGGGMMYSERRVGLAMRKAGLLVETDATRTMVLTQ
jgi:hypothetical protein